MKLVRLFLIAFSIASIGALPAHAARGKPTRPDTPSGSYKGAIVIDAADGRVLFENNADIVSPPASMTKLMTFAVIADRIRTGVITPETVIKVNADDAGMGGTQVYLKENEEFTVDELLYAMMIQSANDAAHALARTAAGSREAFVQMMNDKAREIGMVHSTFRTPHGLTSKRQALSEGDLTTPRDFAILCRYVINNTDVLKYTSVKTRAFAPNRIGGAMRMDNHNKLLGRIAGVDGLKTGYTQNAGYCLSATAERNGRRVILVIMGAFGPKGAEIDLGKARDLKAIDMLERGFSSLSAGAAPAAPAAVRTPAPAPAPVQRPPAAAPAAPRAPVIAPGREASPVSPITPVDDASPIRPAQPSSQAPAATTDAPPTIKFELPPKPAKK